MKESASSTAGGAALLRSGLVVYSMVVFAVLWVGFAMALIVNQGWLDDLWEWQAELPIIGQIALWILFLPITVGLWIWHSTWPTWWRLASLAGLVVWTGVALSSFRNLIQSR